MAEKCWTFTLTQAMKYAAFLRLYNDKLHLKSRDIFLIAAQNDCAASEPLEPVLTSIHN